MSFFSKLKDDLKEEYDEQKHIGKFLVTSRPTRFIESWLLLATKIQRGLQKGADQGLFYFISYNVM